MGIVRGERANFLNDKIRFEWTYQLFDALSYMHSRRIIHRDIKPRFAQFQNSFSFILRLKISFSISKSNIFLFYNETNELSVKIGDFNLSVEENSVIKSEAGTAHYKSPEIINNQVFTSKTDVW